MTLGVQRPKPIRLTDLANPVFPEAAQPMREALAGYGSILQLNSEALLAAAAERTGLDGWGASAYYPYRPSLPRAAA